MKIIQQPFGIGCERFAPACRLGNQAVRAYQAPAIADKVAQQRMAGVLPGADERGLCQLARPSFQVLQPVKFAANRVRTGEIDNESSRSPAILPVLGRIR